MRLLADFERLATALAAIEIDALDLELATLVLSIEDRRFWRHSGVDLLATSRAAARWLLGRAKGGASTIDMQLVRTVTGQRERTAHRKCREMLLAMAARRRFGSERILSAYATVAYCGEGLTGLRAASLRLYNRMPENLTSREKAVVAATLLHPVPALHSDDWRAHVDRRARYAISAFDRVHRTRGHPDAKISDAAP